MGAFDRTRQAWVAVLTLALFLFIAGAVMLGIGINRYNSKKSECSPSFPLLQDCGDTAQCSGVAYAIYYTGNAPNIPYNSSYADAYSGPSRAIAENITAEVGNSENLDFFRSCDF